MKPTTPKTESPAGGRGNESTYQGADRCKHLSTKGEIGPYVCLHCGGELRIVDTMVSMRSGDHMHPSIGVRSDDPHDGLVWRIDDRRATGQGVMVTMRLCCSRGHHFMLHVKDGVRMSVAEGSR